MDSAPAISLHDDAATLAQLAAEHSQLWPAIASHPNAYPDLLEWLGSLGDEAVNDALADRPAFLSDREIALDPAADPYEIARIALVRPTLHTDLARNPATYPSLLDWLESLGVAEVVAAIGQRRASGAVNDHSAIAEVADESVSDDDDGSEFESVAETAFAELEPVLESDMDLDLDASGDSWALMGRYLAPGDRIISSLGDVVSAPIDDDRAEKYRLLGRTSTELVRQFNTRWNVSRTRTPLGAGGDPTLDSAIADIRAFSSRIGKVAIPRGVQARTMLHTAEDGGVDKALDAAVDARWADAMTLYSERINGALFATLARDSVAAQSTRATVYEALLASIPQGLTDLADPAGRTQVDPIVRLGYLHELSPIARVHTPAPTPTPAFSESSVTLDEVETLLPFARRLSEWRSTVVDSSNSVLSFVIQTLAALPARQLRLTVFDPVRLGDSVKPLYAIKDHADEIWGSKIHTSVAELGALLGEIEDHITFVTQKYLGKDFESLHDYNHAAGDVAEPYRVVALFDVPYGFVNTQGYWNDELLERLIKIVNNGPRCGVLTLLHVSDSSQAADLARRFGGVSSLVTATDNSLASAQHEWKSPSPVSIKATLDGRPAFVSSIRSNRVWQPEYDLNLDVVATVLNEVERRMEQSTRTAVDAESVARRAQDTLDERVRRGRGVSAQLPKPGQPNTWWHQLSDKAVTAAFGRAGAADVAEFTLDSEARSHALLGGRPGSGKSVLLHAIIHDLTSRYAPDELELYLLDFKQGVEFKVYATERLPHARVVAVDAEREFGLSVLEALEREVTRRGALFRDSPMEQVTLSGVRGQISDPLPRIVAIIDEFHVLFEQDDAIARKAGAILELLVRQGRAFGIHCLLASQSLSGVNLGSHVLKLIPVRLALMSNESDSLTLLGDDNPDAKLLSKAGEGIINNEGGRRDANSRFQSFYTSPEGRKTHIAALRAKADAEGHQRVPTVFDGQNSVALADYAAEAFAPAAGPLVTIPVGLPVSLGGVTFAELRREPGANLLIVGDAAPVATVIGAAAARSWATGARIDVIDPGGDDSAAKAMAERFSLRTGSTVVAHPRSQLHRVLSEIHAEVTARAQHEHHAGETRLLVISDAHRARGLDQDSDGDDDDYTLLREIAARGPETGVHVILSTDSFPAFSRRIGSSILSDFAVRLIGKVNDSDSNKLLEDSSATALRPFQFLLDDYERSTRVKVRSFETTPNELATLVAE